MTECYDHPQYYHLSYSHGMGEEIGFIRRLLEIYLVSPPAKILEPACGTGRVLVPLAKAGYLCTGFDNNSNAIRYLDKQLWRKGLTARILDADMAAFTIDGGLFDGAVCTVDTFRHLSTEADAISHLQCVARHLRRGGIYLLALHLLPSGGYSSKISRWRDRKGPLDLHTTISVLGVNRRRRQETLSIVYNVRTPRRRDKYRYVYQLRTYTLSQMNSLLKQVPGLKIAAVYDYYAFDATAPVRLNSDTEDALFVLQKYEFS